MTSQVLTLVAGVVRDAATSETLPGAHVYYLDDQGQAQGQATNANGLFAFQAPVGAEIVASYVGYTKATLPGAPAMVFELVPGVDLPTVEIFGDTGRNWGPFAALLGLLLLSRRR